ncbi:MAG TPA: pirin family protein [Chromobacteriaceae bacterium]|nr:pirin family protein [Chromobacteriaceae bacterium]
MSLLQRFSGRESDIGFPVRRLLPNHAVRHVGPFIFLDHMGPAHFVAHGTAGDVRPHPHIGLATVTYLFSGALLHRDSLGSVQRIEPGAVNLMTAGRGIVHSERIPQDIRLGGLAVEGIQMWLALPTALEECEPAFLHAGAETLPQRQQDGVTLRLLMGDGWGLHSPVPFASPIIYAAAELQRGATLGFSANYTERAVYVASGALEIDGEPLHAGELGVLAAGSEVKLLAEDASRIMLLGGEPPDGPRYLDWNFVSSRRERLTQARDDWQHGRFVAVPGETEFIPLP